MALSLFSGCGGDTLGLERAGIKVLAFSEINNVFASSHLSNFPDSVHLPGDITNVNFSQYKDKIDFLFAGFPCQGFSHAGKKNPKDPRNQLYKQFVRATRETRPLYILGENVKGLETMKESSDGRLILDSIKSDFEAIGYSTTHKVVEATVFGVPQKRKRIIIVGWDTSRVANFPNDFWDKIKTPKSPPSLKSFITNSMEGAYRVTNPPNGFTRCALEIADDAEPTGTPHPYVVLKTNEGLLSCSKRDSAIHSEIMDLDAPSKTIICTYGHQPRLLIGLRKQDGTSYVRVMTPDELKQIQGFPANYVLNGSSSHKITQIGNAAPPPMIEAVVRALLEIKT